MIVKPVHHSPHYIVFIFSGALCSVLGISLIFFAIYLAPALLWKWNYAIPQFMINFSAWLTEAKEFVGFWHTAILFSPFLLGSLVCFLIAWIMTRLVERKEAHLAEIIASDKSEAAKKN